MFGLQTFRQYLLGRKFTIKTDHLALQWLRKTPEPMAQTARWLSYIEQFDFDIKHRAGSGHGNADGLFCIPVRENVVRAVRHRSDGAQGLGDDCLRNNTDFRVGDAPPQKRSDADREALTKAQLTLLLPWGQR